MILEAQLAVVLQRSLRELTFVSVKAGPFDALNRSS